MKMFEQVGFRGKPTVLASWPGMGNAGLIAVDYLRRKLDAKIFAELDMSPFFIPDSIVVKDGIAQLPDIPTSIFYYATDPELIIFESNAQVAGREAIIEIKAILDVIVQFPVARIFTFAAFAQPISYKAQSKVLLTCNSQKMMDELRDTGASPMPDGYIAGQNGLLLGVAASRQIDAACLLGTIPGYAANISYPAASIELLKTISNILNYQIDIAELEESKQEMDKQFELIEERIKEYIPNVNEEDETEENKDQETEEEIVPHYIMEKIEKMFSDAAANREKAAELKNELDRWKLFELYENRFLDLFKDKK